MEEKKTRKKKSSAETATDPIPEPKGEEKKKTVRKKAIAAGGATEPKAATSETLTAEKPKRKSTKAEKADDPEVTKVTKTTRGRKSSKSADSDVQMAKKDDTEKKKSSTAKKNADKADSAAKIVADTNPAPNETKSTRTKRSTKKAADKATDSKPVAIAETRVTESKKSADKDSIALTAALVPNTTVSQSRPEAQNSSISVDKQPEPTADYAKREHSDRRSNNDRQNSDRNDRSVERNDRSAERNDRNAERVAPRSDMNSATDDFSDSDRPASEGDRDYDERDRRGNRRRGRRGGRNRRRNRYDDRYDNSQGSPIPEGERNSYPVAADDIDLDEIQKKVEQLVADKTRSQSAPTDAQRNDRRDRPERSDRNDRYDRQDRNDRPERSDRNDRPDRNDRRDRSGDRRRNENYFNDSYGRTRDTKLTDEQIARERELEEYANQFDVDLEQDDVPIVSLDSLRTLETPEHKKHSRAKSVQQSQRDDRLAEKSNARRMERFAPANIAPTKLFTDAQKKDEFLRDFLDSVSAKLTNDFLITSDAHLLVGVSGGVDSIALLDALAQVSQRIGFALTVAHFNHMLRAGDSDEDEKFVMELAQTYNLQVFNGSGDVKEYAEQNSISIEQSARSLRYAFFHRIAKHVKANYIATAHTADDSAETFFINLLRGSGLTGLRGIPAMRPMNKGVIIVRPLIDKKKKTLVEYAHRRNLEWREDESNNLLQFTRNKVRNELIPYLEDKYSPAIVELINRTSRLIDGADKFISDYVDKVAQSVITDRRKDRFSVKLALFQTFDDFIQGEIIQLLISSFFKAHTLPMAIIDRILNLFESKTGAVCEINKLLYAVKDRDTVIFARRRQSADELVQISKEGEFDFFGNKFILSEVEKKDVRLGESPLVEYLDYDLVPAIMYVRPWQEGDSFRPLGMAHGSQKVSDLLTNEKLSMIEKNDILLLTSKTEVLWVCGMRISENFKLRSGLTTRYLRVEYRPNESQE